MLLVMDLVCSMAFVLSSVCVLAMQGLLVLADSTSLLSCVVEFW